MKRVYKRKVYSIKCDECVAAMINGVFCHETGCPNQGKYWDNEDGMWIVNYDDDWYDD